MSKDQDFGSKPGAREPTMLNGKNAANQPLSEITAAPPGEPVLGGPGVPGPWRQHISASVARRFGKSQPVQDGHQDIDHGNADRNSEGLSEPGEVTRSMRAAPAEPSRRSRAGGLFGERISTVYAAGTDHAVTVGRDEQQNLIDMAAATSGSSRRRWSCWSGARPATC